MSISILTSCDKNPKDTELEIKLKKEIAAFQKLDATTIKKIYHISEVEGFERGIRDKCKLLDISIRSFYSLKDGKKYSFFNQKEIKLDLIGEYKDITNFLKYLKSLPKFTGIKELIIESAVLEC